MAPRDGRDKSVWNRITHYIHIVHPPGHHTPHNVHKSVWSRFGRTHCARRVKYMDVLHLNLFENVFEKMFQTFTTSSFPGVVPTFTTSRMCSRHSLPSPSLESSYVPIVVQTILWAAIAARRVHAMDGVNQQPTIRLFPAVLIKIIKNIN